MAKKWTNKNLPGALHYVTGTVHQRKRAFTGPEACRAFLEELQKLRTERDCKLIAFVIMLDHVHFILNPRDGDIQSSTAALKSLSAKRLVELAPENYFLNGEENQVWQESFKSLALWSGWMITQKINYIHANPIRARLCDTAADYKWSSFNSFYNNETDQLLQVDKDWWWPDDADKLKMAVQQEELERFARQEK